MLRLVVLSCLLAAVAAQPIYYCDTASSRLIQDSDFYLLTRRSGDTGYQPGMTCEFNARSPSTAFFVEVRRFQSSSATLTISSGGRVLFRDFRISKYQTSITSTSSTLQIRFDSTGDYSRFFGVELRVRALDTYGCPPGWDYKFGNCYGTSDYSGQLDFFDAQRACNSMRANLLQLPAGYGSSVGAFLRTLPLRLRNFNSWVGLTDRTSAGQFRHYWLNGNRQYQTSEISCISGGSYLSCYSTERCGVANTRSNSYAIYMGSCYNLYDFACSMPAGGASIFYTVPNYTGIGVTVYTFSSAWIYGIVVAVLFVVGLVVGGVYTGVRSRNRARGLAGPAAAVVVPVGRVLVSPPRPGIYPVLQQQQSPVLPYTVQFAAAAPPAYEAAVAGGGGGFSNAGYSK